ncbi:MAG: glycosyltransferase [Gemmataceae bacterium]
MDRSPLYTLIPMHLLLMPLGSSGDVHPFLGLGRALAARGHDVTLLTNGHFRPAAERAGLTFVEIGTEEQYQELIRNPDLWHPMRALRAVFVPEMLEFNRTAFAQIRERTVPGKTVVVAGSLALGARIAREVLDIKLVTVHLQPGIMRSPINPPVFGPRKLPAWFPPWLVRGVYWLGDHTFIDPIVRPAIEPLRHDLGLRPVRRYMNKWWHSPDRILALFPKWFGDGPDWPPQVRHAGFPLYDDRTAQPLPPPVQKFLEAGSPPVVVTFGTGMIQGERYFTAAVDALRLSGRRGLLLTPCREQIPANLPPSVLHVDYLPFSQILPHALALVHHGGVGTCAQGLAAGVPQVVMPLAHDQPDNIDRLARLGVARDLWPKRFTGANLARVLDELLANPQTAPACAEIAAKLRDVDSLTTACLAIEELQA